MKKSIVFFLSGLALLLAGCSKDETTEKPTAESPRHLIVDIDVNYSGESRSVKTGWEAGDVIYVVFDHFFTEDESAVFSNKVYYMTLTYDGSSWKSAISDEALERYLLNRTSGQLAAAYWSDMKPKFQFVHQENYYQYLEVKNGGEGTPGFVIYAVNESYTVEAGKLTASLHLEAPYNALHFSVAGIPSSSVSRYSLYCDNFSWQQFVGFTYMDDSNITSVSWMLNSGINIPAVETPDGIAFTAILKEQYRKKETQYEIRLIDNSNTPSDTSDDIFYTFIETATLEGKEAIKLPSLDDPRWVMSNADGTRGTLNGYEWVKMADGRKWATMNYCASSEDHVGNHFGFDGARSAETVWGEGWRLPSTQEWSSLLTNSSSQLTWLKFDDESSLWGLKITALDSNNTLTLPAFGFIPASGGDGDGFYWLDCGLYWARDNGDIKCLLFDTTQEEFSFDYPGLSYNDELLVRLIVDEDIDSSGVGVDFNGYNDKVLWW